METDNIQFKEGSHMKALVAYFSASGVTAKLAQKLAEAIGAELYEIKPQTPYTAEDLDWRDERSRSSVEMKDPSCRPPMTDTDADVAGADAVFIGFPVWWYREPSIIDSFLDAYDFTDKIIIPFATSGSSGIGDSGERMQKIVGPKAEVLTGKRFSTGTTAEDLAKWVRGLEL